ncbi:27257_t:CDS:1, partial [Dentiscutata erythropus]
AQVDRLVRCLSLDEDERNKSENVSMDVDHFLRHNSRDENADNWEPNRYEIDRIIAHKVVN